MAKGSTCSFFAKNGSHRWRLNYTIQGMRKNPSLGTYPDIGLALACRKAYEVH